MRYGAMRHFAAFLAYYCEHFAAAHCNATHRIARIDLGSILAAIAWFFLLVNY